ncbi:hypothetical protein CDV36_013412, partial [Fusarium kuroshium]
MCGIFGYINYLVEKDRKFILDTLINGQCSHVAPLPLLSCPSSPGSYIHPTLPTKSTDKPHVVPAP